MRLNWESISAPQSIEGRLRLSAVAVVVEALKTPAASMRVRWRLPAIKGIKEQWTVTRTTKKTRRISGSMVFSDRLLDAIREEPTRYTQVSVLAPGLDRKSTRLNSRHSQIS